MSQPRTSTTFAAFQIRSFRFQWPSDLLASWAFEMEILILGWFVLVETQSVFMLTAFGALQFIGTLLAPMFGVGGDRLGRRTMLCAMRAFYLVLAIVIMVMGFNDTLSPTAVIIVAFLGGLAKPSDIVMRNALVADTMPPEYLMNGMGLARTTMDSARIVGALVGAGLFSWLGIGPAYAVVAIFYIASFLFTLGVANIPTAPVLDVDESAASGGAVLPLPLPVLASPFRDLKDGLFYVWNTPAVLAIMWMAFLVNLTGFPISHGLLPYVAQEIYQVDENGLGQLVAAFALGAFIGSMTLAIMGRHKNPARLMTFSIIVWYALLILFVQFDTHLTGLPMLVLTGIAHSMGLTAMGVVLMTVVELQYRGRAMGVRMLAVYGLPMGLLAAGALIEVIGFRSTVMIYSGIGILFTIVISYRWRTSIWN